MLAIFDSAMMHCRNIIVVLIFLCNLYIKQNFFHFKILISKAVITREDIQEVLKHFPLEKKQFDIYSQKKLQMLSTMDGNTIVDDHVSLPLYEISLSAKPNVGIDGPSKLRQTSWDSYLNQIVFYFFFFAYFSHFTA